MSALPTDQILQGDCVTRMKAMPAQSVNFIPTDPPYLAHYQSRDGRKVSNDDNANWIRPAFAEMYRVLAQQSFCVSFYGWTKVDLFMAAWRAAGFRPVGHLVFRKRYASSARFLGYHHEMAYLLAQRRNPAGNAYRGCAGFPVQRQQTPPDAEARSSAQAADRGLLSTGWACP
jgi:adenine-specific DNA-methyltransferase